MNISSLLKMTVVILLVCTVFFKANGREITFENNLSWDQVKKKALENHKFICLFLYDLKSSETSKMINEFGSKILRSDSTMNRFLFTKGTLTKKNDGDVSFSPEQINLVKFQFTIDSLPVICYFSPDGTPVHKVFGFRTADRILLGAKNALVPEGQYFNRIHKFRNGMRGQPFVNELVSKAKEVGDTEIFIEIRDAYLSELEPSSIQNEDDFYFLANYAPLNSGVFKEFLKSKKMVDIILGKGIGDQLIRAAIYKNYFPIVITEGLHRNSEPDFESIKNEMYRFGDDGKREYLRLRALYHYLLYRNKKSPEALKDFITYKSTLRTRFPDEYLIANDLELNNDAWFVFTNSIQKSDLETALVWSRYAVAKNPANANWLDTYANLLYKLNRNSEAIIHEEKAVKLANWSPEFRSNLEKMRKGEKTWPENSPNK